MNNRESSDLPSSSRRIPRRASPKAKVNVKQYESSPARGSIPMTTTTNRTSQYDRNHKLQKQPRVTKDPVAASQDDIRRVSNNLTRMVFNNNLNSDDRKPKVYSKKIVDNHAVSGQNIHNSSPKKAVEETQTQQIKKILAKCLQNFDEGKTNPLSLPKHETASSFSLYCDQAIKREAPLRSTGLLHKTPSAASTRRSDGTTKNPTLLRSYLSESIPRREEVVSKKRNVSNSLISSDSIHHSIYLESGREKRQCLLQYLTNVAIDGQVVIYVNSIPGVESLLHFLNKHGFKASSVHARMLMAESNWILSEFSLKNSKILLIAEDHYHSCPAHFRWVKTIINYDLPICNPTENWAIRNGIVDFSDTLPVHIYTFIKKSCPLDNELVKLLQLDSGDREVS